MAYLKVLEVILLHHLWEVVHLNAADHRTQGKHGGTVFHGGLIVKGALRVNQQYRHLRKQEIAKTTITKMARSLHTSIHNDQGNFLSNF